MCSRNKLVCQTACSCLQERCTTRAVVNTEEGLAVAMDNDALNAALAALVANQQQQQAVLVALANQLNNAPVPAPAPASMGPAPLAPARLDPGIRYSGTTAESLLEWLQVVNQKAVVENWGDAEKRRAAIASPACLPRIRQNP